MPRRRVILDHRSRPSTLPPLRLSRKLLLGPGGGRPLLLATLGVWCLFAMVFFAAAEFVPSDWPLASRAALGMAAAALTLAIAMRVTVRLGARMIEAAVALALAEGRCPSCEYDCRHSPPEADGCSVCPECGAAWRLPPSSLPNFADSP